MSNLEPISPEQALDMYVEGRRDELSDQTLPSQVYRLEAFTQWCDEEDIENLNTLTGRDLYSYRVWRREGKGEGREEVATITLRGQLSTLRTFLRFCADIDAVPEDLYSKVPLPTVSASEGVSDTTLEPNRVVEILDYLQRYEYASRRHVTLLLLWHTGARMGGIRSLDLEDCDLEDDSPGLQFSHRPETDTPLKNGQKGERWNGISGYVAGVLQDYIDGPRDDVTDDHGRSPLLTTTHGRPSGGTIRSTMYAITRPCWRGEGCPHDRDIDECEATVHTLASKCPSSRSPHDVRSGRVTAYRRDGVPRRVVGDRLDASNQVLDRHYDRRNAREKADQRRDYLPDL
ncbi:tyrosine-type recombinase/integrase [Natrinema versiforme]|uniref:Phage integrase/site-specific recombinase n=1 Tax=Natrinema versiforme JCM 10478 TaxID=1227496 RepID=L9XSE0_9EURY|nr:site-specific integrase [Natrinema versiforme]ELY64719.1 phage integrase/site-specific recombinase [Natrinema versiforme JCM 10478]